MNISLTYGWMNVKFPCRPPNSPGRQIGDQSSEQRDKEIGPHLVDLELDIPDDAANAI